MQQKEISGDLSEDTIYYLSLLDRLAEKYPGGYVPAQEIEEIFCWKGVYLHRPSTASGRETIRTTLRLFADEWHNPVADSFDMVSLNIAMVHSALINLDGYYGAGLTRIQNKLHFSSCESMLRRIRSFPHGKEKGLIPDKKGPLVRHYAFDPSHDAALVVDLYRPHHPGRFGHFLFRGEDRNHLDFESLKRVLEEATPTTQYALAHSG